MSVIGITSLGPLLDGAIWLIIFFVLMLTVLIAGALALRAVTVPLVDGVRASSTGPWIRGAFLTFLGLVMFLAFGRGWLQWFQGMGMWRAF